MKDLKELYLHDCGLELEAALIIGENLQGLKVLNLARNKIGEDGVMELILSLKEAECLLLKHNGLDSDSKARVHRIIKKVASKINIEI
jgi:hypothetical protein